MKSTYEQVLARTKPFYSTGVTEPHAAGMALPVFDAQNEVVGALLISGPSSRFTAEVAKSVGDFFFKIADDLTKSLGGKSIRN